MTVLALGLAGCGSGGDAIITAEPLSSDRSNSHDTREAEPNAAWQPDVAAYTETLTFREAVSLALAFDPAMKAAYVEIEAKHGEAVQASFRLNPGLNFEVENFANTKGSEAAAEAEETLGIFQTIELGDKRLKRLAAANLVSSLAGWDYEAARLRAASQAAEAFVDVLAAQDRLAILDDFVEISEKTRSAVEARVRGGRASPIELDRAKVTVARARASIEAERATLAAARGKLSALWGADTPTFARAAGRLGRNRTVPTIDEVKVFLADNPLLARWSDAVGHRYAVLQVERSKAIPNITLGAGIRRFDEDNSGALIASVSVPLQIFDRNEGNITAAERRIAKAEFDAQATRTQLVGLLIEALGALASTDAQARALEAHVLPPAQSAFDKTRAGYAEGKFDLLNVLDAQRALFETRRDLVNARAGYEKARVMVEALIGRDLSGAW